MTAHRPAGLWLISLAAFSSMASMRVCDPMLVALSSEFQISVGEASRVVSAFAVAEFAKDDVAWISPTLNQIHQLQNRDAEEPCMTIQCYMYDQENHMHYDYFDYLDNNGAIQQYEPDSDMDFVAFKELMRTEWENRKPNAGLFACFA